MEPRLYRHRKATCVHVSVVNMSITAVGNTDRPQLFKRTAITARAIWNMLDDTAELACDATTHYSADNKQSGEGHDSVDITPPSGILVACLFDGGYSFLQILCGR